MESLISKMSEDLIYRRDARRVVLFNFPSGAFAIDAIKPVDATVNTYADMIPAEPYQVVMTMKCGRCGAYVLEQDHVCGGCGSLFGGK